MAKPKKIPTTRQEAIDALLPWIERQLRRPHICFLKTGYYPRENMTVKEYEFTTIALRFTDPGENHYYYVKIDLPYAIKAKATFGDDWPILICNLTMQEYVRNYACIVYREQLRIHKTRPFLSISMLDLFLPVPMCRDTDPKGEAAQALHIMATGETLT